MVTPDFEDWLARQDIPIEDTLTIEDFQAYLADELGYTFPYGVPGPSLLQQAVVGKIWAEKYDILAPLGIYPTTYTYKTGPRAGQRETRWVIPERPGLWGYESLLRILRELEEE